MTKYVGLIAGVLLVGLSMSGCTESRTEFTNLSKAPAASMSIDGKAIYTAKCMKCHGEMGTEHPLAEPYVIAGQAKELLIAKINGYQNHTFGGDLRGVMAPQVGGLTEEEVNSVSEYISKL